MVNLGACSEETSEPFVLFMVGIESWCSGCWIKGTTMCWIFSYEDA